MKIFIQVYHGSIDAPGIKLFQKNVTRFYPDALQVVAHYDDTLTITCNRNIEPFLNVNEAGEQSAFPRILSSIADLGELVKWLKSQYHISCENTIAYIEGNLRSNDTRTNQSCRLTAAALNCLNALEPGVAVFFAGTSACRSHIRFCLENRQYPLHPILNDPDFKDQQVKMLAPLTINSDTNEYCDQFTAQDDTLQLTFKAPLFAVLDKEHHISSISKVAMVSNSVVITPEQSVSKELSMLDLAQRNETKNASVFERNDGLSDVKSRLEEDGPLKKSVSNRSRQYIRGSGFFSCCSTACADVVPQTPSTSNRHLST